MRTTLMMAAALPLLLTCLAPMADSAVVNPTASAVITGTGMCSTLTDWCSYSVTGHHTSALPGTGSLSGGGASASCSALPQCTTGISGGYRMSTAATPLCNVWFTAVTTNALGPSAPDVACF